MMKPDAVSPSTQRAVPGWTSLTVIAAALALSACSSTPLPAWNSTPIAGGQPAPGTVTTKPASGPSPVQIPGIGSPGVVATPVETVPLQGSPLGGWKESDEVAARFPDPERSYATPGLSAGRTTYTSNAEPGPVAAPTGHARPVRHQGRAWSPLVPRRKASPFWRCC